MTHTYVIRNTKDHEIRIHYCNTVIDLKPCESFSYTGGENFGPILNYLYKIGNTECWSLEVPSGFVSAGPADWQREGF